MRWKIRIIALAFAVSLVLPGVLLSPPLPAHAQTISDLYGTGSADELNIVKLIDMALNRGGMSMSPATIRSFLDFWWSSVQSDLQQCISNIGTAYDTSQAFINALVAGLANTDHYDKLGGIITKYVQYCYSLGEKSVSDFVQLITQAGTFRRFLLSYVTDGDGNIVNTVDNKIKKYNLKGGLVNMVRQAADFYIEEHEGYYLVHTFTYKNFPASVFDNKAKYDFICNTFKTAKSDGVYFLQNFSGLKIYQATGYSFVGTLENNKIEFSSYASDWTSARLYSAAFTDFSAGIDLSKYNPSSDSDKISIPAYQNYIITYFGKNGSMEPYLYPVTADGRTIKVWKTLDGFKNHTVGRSDIYYTNSYSKFDSSVDNSIEFTGSYYNSTTNNYSHDNIQNTIDNSQETINESTVNNIVNNYITNVTNNYGGGSGSGDDDSGGDWNLGEGIEAFVKSIMELLDFVLKLLGDLVGLLGRFLTDVLEVFKSLGVVGSEFGGFLKEVFSFLPEECISLIISSIGSMCIVGVIKAIKK